MGKNVIYEKAKFNQKSQAQGESVELFITALQQAADNCEYGATKEELIRDRIVFASVTRHCLSDSWAVKEQGSELLNSGPGDTQNIDSLGPTQHRFGFGRGTEQLDGRSTGLTPASVRMWG